MADEMITSKAEERIRAIHALSVKYNGVDDGNHQKKLLSLMREHIDEIEELVAQKNPHFLVETGDLLVLCLELLLENQQEINEVMSRCCGRYEKKLTELLRKNSEMT